MFWVRLRHPIQPIEIHPAIKALQTTVYTIFSSPTCLLWMDVWISYLTNNKNTSYWSRDTGHKAKIIIIWNSHRRVRNFSCYSTQVSNLKNSGNKILSLKFMSLLTIDQYDSYRKYNRHLFTWYCFHYLLVPVLKSVNCKTLKL